MELASKVACVVFGLLCAIYLTVGFAYGGLAIAAPETGPKEGVQNLNPAAEFQNNPTLMFRVALRYSQRGLYGRAIPILASFVQAFPNRAEHRRASFMLADAYFFIAQTGASVEFDNAIKAYLLALSLYPQAPQMPSAYFRLGQAYKTKLMAAEAQVAFRTLLERAPESPQAPQAQLEIAERYVALGDPKSAVIEFQKILNKYKGSPAEKDAHFGIANALFNQRIYQKALEQFNSGQKRWSDFLRLRPNLLFNYAETLFQVRDFTKAGNAFLRMVNVNPSSDYSHRALARLGDIQLELGRIEDAIRIYSQVISSHPKTEGSWVSLIRVADIGVEGKFKEPPGMVFPNNALRDPLSAYWQVIGEAQSSRLAHVAYLRIATYHLKRGDLRETIKSVQDFLAKFPKSPLSNNANIIMARAYFDEIGRFYGRKQFLRAIKSYDEFRSAVPDRVSLLAKPFKAMVVTAESYCSAPGLLDTRLILFHLMRPAQAGRVYSPAPGRASGSRGAQSATPRCSAA